MSSCPRTSGGGTSTPVSTSALVTRNSEGGRPAMETLRKGMRLAMQLHIDLMAQNDELLNAGFELD